MRSARLRLHYIRMSEPTPPQPPGAPSSVPRSASVAAASPFPDPRDIYLLVAGVVLGVLLSPAVLGNLGPDSYNRLFVGGQQVQAQIAELTREHQRTIAELEAVGVTDVAIDEQQRQFEHELGALQAVLREAHRDHLHWLAGRGSALILVLGLVMVLEVLASPHPAPGKRVAVPRALSRLIAIRYALLALWIALAIAQPAVLGELPIVFIVLLIAIALLAAFVPLGPKRDTNQDTQQADTK